MSPRHSERHRTDRIGWLRAAVLGANDGIVSTASLVLGVAAANAGHSEVMVAGIAGLVAGAMSMAAGEYVSVSSQADTEQAALERERTELRSERRRRTPRAGRDLRGPRPRTRRSRSQVADQLMAHDALGAHARDELGISETLSARPDPGGAHLGGELRRRRGPAAAGRCRGPGAAHDPRRLRSVAWCSSRSWAGWLRAWAVRG